METLLRKSGFFCFLLFLIIVPLFSQEIQLEMDIVGWSDQGLFCWRERVTQDNNTQRLITIVDLVTDETLFHGPEPETNSARDTLYRRYTIDTTQKGRSNGGNRLVFDGDLYETDLFSESDRVSVRFKNVTRGVMKEVNSGPLRGDEMTIKGAIISPFEKRAALVFLRKGSGSASYVVMGAHLTLGFSPIPLEEEELIDAVLNGQYYLCRLLLSQGTHPDSVKDSRGYTPLLLAVRNDKWQISRLLLENGADPHVKDEEGNTPADYARAAGQTELAELFR
jgi:hypothetical protein